MDRRAFLQFMGRGTAAGVTIQMWPAWANRIRPSKTEKFMAISPTGEDAVVLAEGLQSEVVLKWGDVLDSSGRLIFGFNADFTAYFPLPNTRNEGIIWVNHEYTHPLFVSSATNGRKSRAQVEMEMRSVGGSLVHIRRSHGSWRLVADSPYNRRIDALTSIPFAWPEKIDGMESAIGTLQNCAGGVTPWNTILSCEENYQAAFGEVLYENGGRRHDKASGIDGWHAYYDHSPEHYGWVVEIDPMTGTSKKLISMGRFCHEGATTVVAEDGRCVVYMGDDAANECIYKFIADRPGSLDSGELYVADTFNGKWISLNIHNNKDLQSHFTSQTEVLLRTREAARVVGGTPQDRPEDIAIDPYSGAVVVALTNNKAAKNLFGSLLKIEEANRDPRALEFKASVLLMGGTASGFACPDNLRFDAKGNLWMTSDISSSSLGKKEYAPFGNNGLFVIPMSGPNAGRALQVASAPVEAEFTGPSFTPDGKTLFLSVQHPGEESKDLGNCTSHWPDGGNTIPKPAVIAITGPLLAHPERIVGG